MQLEVALSFFVGTYEKDMSYNDDIKRVAMTNFGTPTAFWFDSVTSIPWSFLDYLVYQAGPL